MLKVHNINNNNRILYSWKPSEINKKKSYKTRELNYHIPKVYNLLETVYTPRQDSLKIDLNIGIAASICELIEFIEFNNDCCIYKPSKLFLYNIVFNYYSDVMYLYDYFEILDHYGICSEDSYPFITANISKLPPTEIILESFKKRDYEFYTINQNLLEIQSYLLDNIPILFGLKTPISGIQLNENNIFVSLYNTEYNDYGNIVIAYGYDNNNQTLLIKHPLDTKLGIDGYFWLPYNILLNPSICDEFTIISKKKLIKKLNYNHDNLMKILKIDDIENTLEFCDIKSHNNYFFNMENSLNTLDSNSITLSCYNDNTNIISNNKCKNNIQNDSKNDDKSNNYSISMKSKELDGCEIKINI